MEESLEGLLNRFSGFRQFHHPLCLSREYPDVTIKYALAMLKLASSNEQRTRTIDSFCAKFDADRFEMDELFSDIHNMMEYRLYTAFSAHCQQQLKLSDKEFFEGTAKGTFLNRDDLLITMARWLTAPYILGRMPDQFKNWTRVTQVEVEKFQLGSSSFRITRRTLPEYKEKLQQILDEKSIAVILQRDCDLTVYAFQITFQKLFNQKELHIERVQSEAQNNSHSEYLIYPSAPYRSIAEDLFTKLKGAAVYLFVPQLKIRHLEAENQALKETETQLEQTIQQRLGELRHKNAELQRMREEILSILERVSLLRLSGTRHSIINMLQEHQNVLKNAVVKSMAGQVYLCHLLAQNQPEKERYIREVAGLFGVSRFDSTDEIEKSLHRVILLPRPTAENDDLINMLDNFFSEEVYLFDAYVKTVTKNKTSPFDFNPFQLFQTVLAVQELCKKIGRLAALKDVRLFEQILFSEAVKEGLAQAQSNLNYSLETVLDLSYNPILTTNRASLVYIIRDLAYNSIRFKGTEIKVSGRSSAKNLLIPGGENLPLEKSVFYCSVEDNGMGIPENVAAKLNLYLSGAEMEASQLSTKTKEGKEGGGGTSALRGYLNAHGGRAFYEPLSRGTKVHLFFKYFTFGGGS